MATVTETVTETTTEGYGSRLSGSLRGVIGGLGMFVAAFPLLFWNEGNSVKVAKALDEGEGVCVALEQIKKVDSENEGQLVHATGKAETEDVLTDDTFGVTAKAIALKRTVEMFQWHETSKTEEKKNLGGRVTRTTTYKYTQEWDDKAIDSSGFHDPGHENPGSFEYESEEKRAANVSFGAFHLNEKQISRIGSAQAYAFPTDWVCRVERVQRVGKMIYIPNQATRSNALNNRKVQAEPRIGDMRVRIEVILPHTISLVAKQKGDTFAAYLAKTKKRVDLLQDGAAEADEMFEDARDKNAVFTWFVRILGFLLMYWGIGKALKPLSVLADVLPLLGDLLEVGTSVVSGIVAFVCAVATIGVAWVFYRPVLGVILLLLAAGGVFLLWKKRAAIKAHASAAMDKAREIKSAADATPSPQAK